MNFFPLNLSGSVRGAVVMPSAHCGSFLSEGKLILIPGPLRLRLLSIMAAPSVERHLSTTASDDCNHRRAEWRGYVLCFLFSILIPIDEGTLHFCIVFRIQVSGKWCFILLHGWSIPSGKLPSIKPNREMIKWILMNLRGKLMEEDNLAEGYLSGWAEYWQCYWCLSLRWSFMFSHRIKNVTNPHDCIRSKKAKQSSNHFTSW